MPGAGPEPQSCAGPVVGRPGRCTRHTEQRTVVRKGHVLHPHESRSPHGRKGAGGGHCRLAARRAGGGQRRRRRVARVFLIASSVRAVCRALPSLSSRTWPPGRPHHAHRPGRSAQTDRQAGGQAGRTRPGPRSAPPRGSCLPAPLRHQILPRLPGREFPSVPWVARLKDCVRPRAQAAPARNKDHGRLVRFGVPTSPRSTGCSAVRTAVTGAPWSLPAATASSPAPTASPPLLPRPETVPARSVPGTEAEAHAVPLLG